MLTADWLIRQVVACDWLASEAVCRCNVTVLLSKLARHKLQQRYILHRQASLQTHYYYIVVEMLHTLTMKLSTTYFDTSL